MLSGGDVEDGDETTIYLPASAGREMRLRGEIVNHVFEVGFAVRFNELNDEDRDHLKRIIASLSSD
jgi:hypothetical protein